MQTINGRHDCPSCQRPLMQVAQDRYHCEEHGEWVPYGPKLLVLAPRLEEQVPRMLLPWETHSA